MISIVIPVHNRGKLLEEALQSIYAQTHPAAQIEIIIVDDGSTEDLSSIKQHHPKTIWIHQKQRGVSAARNAGIAQACGEWIALLDSDDLWLPEKLQTQWAFHEANPSIAISHTKEQWIRNGKPMDSEKYLTYPNGEFFLDSLQKCCVGPSTVMFKKSLFETAGGFDETLEVCEDYDLWLRIARITPIGLIPYKFTLKRGGHDDQLSTRHWGMDRFRITALQKHLDSPHHQAVLEEIIRKCDFLCQGAEKRGNHALLEQYQKEKARAVEQLRFTTRNPA